MSDTPIDEGTNSSDINISDIISRLTQNPTPEGAQNQKPQESGDILSSLLSNPELMMKIPQIISLLSPMFSGLFSTQKEEKRDIEAQQASAPAHTSPPSPAHLPIPKASSHTDSRAALLCAIKPYLCSDRQAAVDYIIKLSRLGEILKTL